MPKVQRTYYTLSIELRALGLKDILSQYYFLCQSSIYLILPNTFLPGNKLTLYLLLLSPLITVETLLKFA